MPGCSFVLTNVQRTVSPAATLMLAVRVAHRAGAVAVGAGDRREPVAGGGRLGDRVGRRARRHARDRLHAAVGQVERAREAGEAELRAARLVRVGDLGDLDLAEAGVGDRAGDLIARLRVDPARPVGLRGRRVAGDLCLVVRQVGAGRRGLAHQVRARADEGAPAPAVAGRRLDHRAVDLEVEAPGIAGGDELLDDGDLRLLVVAEVLAVDRVGGDRAPAAAEVAALAGGEATGRRGVRVRALPAAVAAGGALLAQAVRRGRGDDERVAAEGVRVVVGLAGVADAVVVVVRPDAPAREPRLAGVALAVAVEIVELRAVDGAVAPGDARVRRRREDGREERSQNRRPQARRSNH